MKAYLYCSYTGSPVGFVMGVTEKLDDGKWSPMNMNGIPKDIRGCFEHAIFRNAAGNFVFPKPEGESGDRWIILLKNITYELPESENNLTYYINIAFETADRAEYEKWMGPADMDNLGERVASCLDITKSSDFGYVVKENNLSSLVESSLRAIPKEIAAKSLENCCLEFVPRLPSTERKNFIRTFAPALLPCDLVDFQGNSGWCFVKKKLKTPLGKYATAIGVAIVILAGIWIMLPADKKKFSAHQASVASKLIQEEQIRKNLKLVLHTQNQHLKILDASVFLGDNNNGQPAILLLANNQLERNIIDYLNSNGKIKFIKQSDPPVRYEENGKEFRENIFYGELILLNLNQKLPIFIIDGNNNIFKKNQTEPYEIQCKIEKND